MGGSLVVLTPPTTEPLTVAEVQTHLRDIFADDTLLSSFITAARQYAETFTGRAFIQTGFRYTLDHFPYCGSEWRDSYRTIELPRPTLMAVSAITYVDTSGVTQTMSTSDYSVDTDHLPGRIVLGYGKAWPYTRCQPNAVTIAYTAGYGTSAASVPDTIKAAMLLLIGDLWENREAKIPGIIQENRTVGDLLWSERMVVLA